MYIFVPVWVILIVLIRENPQVDLIVHKIIILIFVVVYSFHAEKKSLKVVSHWAAMD